MLAQLSKPARRLIAMTLVAMLMVSSFFSPAPTMAQSQSIQSSLTGVTISYGPPYELQEDGRYADDVMETMMFLGAADILAMGFMTPLIDLNGARDIMLEALFGEIGSAATIDRGDYTGVSYSLDMLNIDGQEMGVFSLFMNQRSHGFSEFYIFIAPPALFGATMQTAQNSFTINGSPLMDGVDATAMGNMVTANIGITGGTAVTDVTDVAQPSDPDPTPDTGQTGTTTETDQSARLAYLLEITFEYGAVDTAIGTIFATLSQMEEGEIDAQTARPLLDEQYVILAGTNDRVGAIQVPAGMEAFHQEVLLWSDAVTHAGDQWFAFVDGSATSEDASTAMIDAIDVHLEFGEKLQAENMAGASDPEPTATSESTGTTGSTRSTRSTGTTEATEVAQTGSTSEDADAYIEAIQNHRQAFFESLAVWNESLDLLTDNASDADIQAARDGSLAEAEFWAGFSANAQQLTPPPGYEDVHDAYLTWAAEITELGNLWIGGLNQDSAMIDQFFEHLTVVQEADDNLQAAIASSGQQGDTGANSSSSSSSDTTEASTNSNRSSRSTGSSTSDDTTETSSRPDRTTRGSQSDTSGNTSETSGRTSASSSSAANEWLMEANNVTITWSDSFALNETAEDPQISDASIGEDKIYLQATSQNGSVVRFTVTVYENSSADSTAMINGLVNDSDAVLDLFGDGAEVIDYEIAAEASAILVRATDEIGDFWVYAQVTCVTQDCDTVSLLLIAVEGDPLVDVLDDMENGIAIEGTSISSAIPVADVEDAVDQFGN